MKHQYKAANIIHSFRGKIKRKETQINRIWFEFSFAHFACVETVLRTTNFVEFHSSGRTLKLVNLLLFQRVGSRVW